MTGAPPAVQADGLTVTTADGRLLLDHLTVEIGQGERVLIVGPSGSGKSTLLRAVAGLPGTGSLELTGS